MRKCSVKDVTEALSFKLPLKDIAHRRLPNAQANIGVFHQCLIESVKKYWSNLGFNFYHEDIRIKSSRIKLVQRVNYIKNIYIILARLRIEQTITFTSKKHIIRSVSNVIKSSIIENFL